MTEDLLIELLKHGGVVAGIGIGLYVHHIATKRSIRDLPRTERAQNGVWQVLEKIREEIVSIKEDVAVLKDRSNHNA